MDKKQFDEIFATSILDVGSELNTLESSSERRHEFFKHFDNAGFDEEKAFERSELQLYTQKLLYSVLSNIFVNDN